MNQYIITALVDIVLATIAFRKKNNLAAKALAYTLFSAAIWTLELYVLSTVRDEELLNSLFHITRWGLFFVPPCFALLTWRLMGSKSQLFLKAVIIPGFVVSLLLGIVNLFFYQTELLPTESGYLPNVDAIYYVFISCFVLCFVGSIIFSLICLQISTNREKQKIKWLLITLVGTFSCGAINILFMPHDFYLSRYMGSISNIVFFALLFYSTIQHHLMDFRLAVSVSLTRAVILAFFVWSFFLIMSLTGPFEEKPGGVFAFVGMMVIMLELYPRILNWLLPNTKKLISGDSYDFEETKTSMQAALNDSVNMQTFVSSLDNLLLQVVNVRNYSLLLVENDNGPNVLNIDSSNDVREVACVSPDDFLVSYCAKFSGLVMTDETPPQIQEKLAEHDAVMSFCVTFESQPIALVLVGNSKGHSYYRYDDIRVFEWLQLELGQAITRIYQLDEMQDQLGQAKKTLSMLGVMNHYHHDIKAPLAIIDGVLSNDIYDKEKQKDIVLQQVERGSRLIATMAGILKGERKRKVQALSLGEVVKDSLFLFSQGIDEVNYLFSDVPKILGDAEDLKILVINIVKNAMEARREGERLIITVSTWQDDDHICLSLADTGLGMTQEGIQNLWEDAVSMKKHGSGIGLQAIKRIADEHSAEIDVRSVKGQGSEFIFKFPSALAVEEELPSIGKSGDNIFTSKDRVNKPLAG